MRDAADYKLTLFDLPHEVLEQIFCRVAGKDIKLLSCVNRECRDKVSFYLFRKIRGSWEQLTELGDSKVSFVQKNYVRDIEITSAEAKYEYQTNALQRVLNLSVFPNVTGVSVNSNSLSFWLKNHDCPNISVLLLYLASSSRGSEKLFHLSHVDLFSNLRKLYLSNYNFRWGQDDEVQPLSALQELNLYNCTWEYPFNLARFNQHDTLTSLTITYSDDNTFVLLERYLDYLRTPFQGHLHSLRRVDLAFTHCRLYNGHLSPTVLYNFLECFSGLEELKLRGWATNLESLRYVLLARDYEDPFNLRIEVGYEDEQAIMLFLHQVRKHNLEVKVAIMDESDQL